MLSMFYVLTVVYTMFHFLRIPKTDMCSSWHDCCNKSVRK